MKLHFLLIASLAFVGACTTTKSTHNANHSDAKRDIAGSQVYLNGLEKLNCNNIKVPKDAESIFRKKGLNPLTYASVRELPLKSYSQINYGPKPDKDMPSFSFSGGSDEGFAYANTKQEAEAGIQAVKEYPYLLLDGRTQRDGLSMGDNIGDLPLPTQTTYVSLTLFKFWDAKPSAYYPYHADGKKIRVNAVSNFTHVFAWDRGNDLNDRVKAVNKAIDEFITNFCQ